MWKPEFLSMILSAAVSLLTLFTFFQSRMTSTEKRLTILEEKNKQNDKELEETKSSRKNTQLVSVHSARTNAVRAQSRSQRRAGSRCGMGAGSFPLQGRECGKAAQHCIYPRATPHNSRLAA